MTGSGHVESPRDQHATAEVADAIRLAGQRVVVMGVSSSGKSTVGKMLAERLGVEYADADDFHSADNRKKMSAGIALTDTDRLPWLHSIGDWLATRRQEGAVVTCSALKRSHRDVLRGHAEGLWLLHLSGSAELIEERMAGREGHFMPASLLRSQFEELEPPESDERAITEETSKPPDEIVARFMAGAVRRIGGTDA